MRWIFTILLPCLALAQGRPLTSQLLRCLGQEEKALHQQKKLGAIYDLNQRLIGELILINGLDGNTQLLTEACSVETSAAVVLLREMMLRPKKWYVLKSQPSSLEMNISAELVKDLNMGAPEILLNFISMLQAESPTPGCLETHIPGLKKLHEDVKWLQEEMDLHKITEAEKKLAQIFKDLGSPAKILARCQADLQRSRKSKKTDNGSAKPSAQ